MIVLVKFKVIFELFPIISITPHFFRSKELPKSKTEVYSDGKWKIYIIILVR